MDLVLSTKLNWHSHKTCLEMCQYKLKHQQFFIVMKFLVHSKKFWNLLVKLSTDRGEMGKDLLAKEVG